MKNTGRYIGRLLAFISIVIGAEMVSEGMTALRLAEKTGETVDLGPALIGGVIVVLGCLLMAKLSMDKQKNRRMQR